MTGPGASRSDPSHEAAERAKAAARESVTWLRDEAGRLHENYSKQSKYFKWRSWIIASYAAIAVASLTTVYLLKHNGLKAYVSYTYLEHLIVHVENNSPDDWTHVRLLLNDEWEFEKDRVASGTFIAPNSSQFHRKGSKSKDEPAANVPFKTLHVSCDQGSFTQRSE